MDVNKQFFSFNEKLSYIIDREEQKISIPMIERANLTKIVSKIIKQTNISAFDLSEYTVDFIK